MNQAETALIIAFTITGLAATLNGDYWTALILHAIAVIGLWKVIE